MIKLEYRVVSDAARDVVSIAQRDSSHVRRVTRDMEKTVSLGAKQITFRHDEWWDFIARVETANGGFRLSTGVFSFAGSSNASAIASAIAYATEGEGSSFLGKFLRFHKARDVEVSFPLWQLRLNAPRL